VGLLLQLRSRTAKARRLPLNPTTNLLQLSARIAVARTYTAGAPEANTNTRWEALRGEFRREQARPYVAGEALKANAAEDCLALAFHKLGRQADAETALAKLRALEGDAALAGAGRSGAALADRGREAAWRRFRSASIWRDAVCSSKHEERRE